MGGSRNWSGTQRWHPARRTAAGPAFRRGEVAPGRIRGSGHAFNAQGATEGVEYLARKPREGRVTVFERQGETVARLPAGLSIGEVAGALARADHRLAAPPTSQYPTVGGFVATGGHGSAASVGTLAGSGTLVELELIDPTGRLHRLDGDTPDEVDAARVSLGALGWLRSVTVRLRPGASVVHHRRPGDLDDALHPDFRLGHEQAEAWWFAPTERVQLVSVDPTEAVDHEGGKGGGGRFAGASRLLGEDVPLAALDAALRVRPSASPWLTDLAARVAVGDVSRRGDWDVLCVGPRRLRGVSTEMAVPVDRSDEAIRAVAGVIDRHRRERGFALAFPVNLRWAAADRDRSLAPNADGDVLFVDVTVPRRRTAIELLVAVEDALIPLGGLPHWGKAFVRSPVARLPHWSMWQAVRRRFDPDDLLVNPFLARLLRS